MHTLSYTYTFSEFLPLKNQSNKMFETMKPRWKKKKKGNKSTNHFFLLSHNKIMTRISRDNKRSDLCFLLSINSFFLFQKGGDGKRTWE